MGPKTSGDTILMMDGCEVHLYAIIFSLRNGTQSLSPSQGLTYQVDSLNFMRRSRKSHTFWKVQALLYPTFHFKSYINHLGLASYPCFREGKYVIICYWLCQGCKTYDYDTLLLQQVVSP